MGKTQNTAAWMLALLGMAGFAGFAMYSGKLGTDLEQLRAEKHGLELKLGAVQQRLELATKSDSNRPSAEDVHELKASLASAQAEIAQLKASLDPSPLAVFSTKGDDDAEPASEPGQAFAEMMAGMMENEDFKAATTEMAVNLQYGSLLRDLALPSEVRDDVTEILAASMTGGRQGAAAIASDGDESARGDTPNTAKANAIQALRDQLSDVLTDEELELWEDFEANKEQRILEQQFDMSLGMFAPDLTAENQMLVRDVLVEETMLMQVARSEGEDFDMKAEMAAQLSVYDNARQRLSPMMDDDQWARTTAFLESQERFLRMWE